MLTVSPRKRMTTQPHSNSHALATGHSHSHSHSHSHTQPHTATHSHTQPQPHTHTHTHTHTPWQGWRCDTGLVVGSVAKARHHGAPHTGGSTARLHSWERPHSALSITDKTLQVAGLC